MEGKKTIETESSITKFAHKKTRSKIEYWVGKNGQCLNIMIYLPLHELNVIKLFSFNF